MLQSLFLCHVNTDFGGCCASVVPTGLHVGFGLGHALAFA